MNSKQCVAEAVRAAYVSRSYYEIGLEGLRKSRRTYLRSRSWDRDLNPAPPHYSFNSLNCYFL